MDKSIQKQLGGLVDFNNLVSKHSGNTVCNQFEVNFENGRMFKSYNTNIAAITRDNGKRILYLDPAHACSVTTSKYCKQFTDMSKKERETAIKDGHTQCFEVVKLVNLN